MTSLLLEPAVRADRSFYSPRFYPPLSKLVSKVVRAENPQTPNTQKTDRILTSIRIDERHEKHETGQRVSERPFRSPHSRAVVRTRPRFGSGGRLAEGRLGGETLFFPKVFSRRGGGGGGEAGAAQWCSRRHLWGALLAAVCAVYCTEQ